MKLVFCFILLLFIPVATCCSSLLVKSLVSDDIVFSQLSMEQEVLLSTSFRSTGRPSYVSQQSTGDNLFLFHMHNSASGLGRWIISERFGALEENVFDSHRTVHAFVDSWAVVPYLLDFDRSDSYRHQFLWYSLQKNGKHQLTSGVIVVCENAAYPRGEPTSLVYFESSSDYQSSLSGFYVFRGVYTSSNAGIEKSSGSNQHRVYSQVFPDTSGNSIPKYLFSMPTRVIESSRKEEDLTISSTIVTTWLIGEEYGKDSGVAYFDAVAQVLGTEELGPLEERTVPFLGHGWRFVDESEGHFPWKLDETATIYAVPAILNQQVCDDEEKSQTCALQVQHQTHNIYQVLRQKRYLEARSFGKSYRFLR
jgi:hypothetical protein